MDELPDGLSDTRIIETLRNAMLSPEWSAKVLPESTLRISRRVRARRVRDSAVVGYSVTVQVDPNEHRGRWGASTVIVVNLGPEGGPRVSNDVPDDEPLMYDIEEM